MLHTWFHRVYVYTMESYQRDTVRFSCSPFHFISITISISTALTRNHWMDSLKIQIVHLKSSTAAQSIINQYFVSCSHSSNSEFLRLISVKGSDFYLEQPSPPTAKRSCFPVPLMYLISHLLHILQSFILTYGEGSTICEVSAVARTSHLAPTVLI